MECFIHVKDGSFFFVRKGDFLYALTRSGWSYSGSADDHPRPRQDYVRVPDTSALLRAGSLP